jgi:tetratricopeptide (TPR) repeat protein
MRVRQRPQRTAAVAAAAAVVFAVLSAYLWTAYHLAAARAARRADDCARAERHLSACWRLPGMSEAVEREELLLGMQQGDVVGMGKHLIDLVRGNDEDAVLILEALAKGYLALFRWSEAQECADELVRRQPGDAGALVLRARAWEKLKQDDHALADYRAAVELDPSSWPARLGLAETLLRLGHVREAAGHFELLRRQHPGRAEAVVGLARCHHDAAEPAAAERLLDALLAEQPGHVRALVERGRVALRRGQPAEAERWLRRAWSAAPGDRDAGYLLLVSLDAQGRDDPALRRQVEDDERTLGALRYKMRAGARDPAVLCAVGRYMLRTSQDDQTPGWFFRALAEDPRHPAAHAALADYFAKHGQPARADRHRRQAVRP